MASATRAHHGLVRYATPSSTTGTPIANGTYVRPIRGRSQTTQTR